MRLGRAGVWIEIGGWQRWLLRTDILVAGEERNPNSRGALGHSVTGADKAAAEEHEDSERETGAPAPIVHRLEEALHFAGECASRRVLCKHNGELRPRRALTSPSVFHLAQRAALG